MAEVTFSKPATYSKVRVVRAELPRTNDAGEWALPQEVAILRCRATAGPAGWSVWTPDTYERGGVTRPGTCLVSDLLLAEARELARIVGSAWREGQSAEELMDAMRADARYRPLVARVRQRRDTTTTATE